MKERKRTVHGAFGVLALASGCGSMGSARPVGCAGAMCFSGAGFALLAPVDHEELRQATIRVCRNAECVHYELPSDEVSPPGQRVHQSPEEPFWMTGTGSRVYQSPEGRFWIMVTFQVEPDGTYVRIQWMTLRFDNLLPGDVYRAEIKTSSGNVAASRTVRAKRYIERTLNGSCGPTCRNAVLDEPDP